MKNNNADKVLKEKLGSLDTLSGGIVYGKEEAWDKLQGRLDAKPAKRIELKYGMAAALVILLGFTGFYFYPAKQNVSAKTPVAKIASAPRLVTPALTAAQPETMAVHTSTNIKEIAVQKTKGAQVSHTSRVWDTLTAPVAEAPTPNEIAIQTIALTPALTAKAHMKVINIRDLENSTTATREETGITLNSEARIDLGKLQVVNMNDLFIEDFEIKRIRRENRFSFGDWSDMKPGRADNPREADNDLFQKHSFKIKFNFQNQ